MDNRPHGNQGQSMFGPSDRLTAEFRACCRDPTDAIETRLRFMLQTFLQHHKDTAGDKNNHLAAKSCCAAAIWYYRILENILSQEKERLDIKDGSRDTPPLSPYPCQGRGGRASRQSQQVSSSLLIFNSETPGDREEGEDEDGPPAKRLRVAETFLQRRLRSIANDREAQRDRDQPSMSQPDLH
ncbi:hypothetical protein KUCAC02_001909 [Chaenocephalus aceratus]|uniref:Uncharacterized protein n=1 Tax=Chaenocephalus aceratus TaxID=36190 RepID=A0ACB9XU44_CHAAC|nr:hypothetical protein KUCAC02_001909 [Chaenocephalus aceratus]